MASQARRGGRRRTRGAVRLVRVRKRDGREAPWDLAKIEAAVAAAMRAVGESDPLFAAEVADVVELALLERAGRDRGADGPVELVPGIEEIQDLVEEALVELGRARVAKAYILYRDRRARARSALSVGPADPAARGAAAVRVREAGGFSPWSKGRIVAVLMEEAELPRETAEEVAARVERRVLASGLTRLSTALVRELVASELVDLGLTSALERQGAVAVPRHDLRRILRGEPLLDWEGAGVPVQEHVAAEVLGRFALDEVLGEALCELHLRGDLHVEDLARVHQPLSIALSAELLVEGTPGPRSAFRLLDAVAGVLSTPSRTLVLEEPGVVLAPLLRATRERSPIGLSAFLHGLSGVARGAGRRIVLGSPGARHRGLTERLVEELAELPDGPLPISLQLLGSDLDLLLEERPAAGSRVEGAIERTLASGRLLASFDRGEERCVGPGLYRRPRERGVLSCAAAVALNLPRLARRAGPWREDVFLEGVSDLVRCAVEACQRMAAFSAGLRGSGDGLAPVLAARPAFALVPVGLRDALRILGDGEIDPVRGARILGLVAEAGRRFAGEGGPRLVLSPAFAKTACARLAALDRRDRGTDARQHWLFPGAESAAGPRTRLSRGFVLSPVHGMAPGEAEAVLLSTVGAGALELARGVAPLPALDPAASAPHVAAWRRFRALARTRGEAEGKTLFPATRGAPSGPVAPGRPFAHGRA